MADDFISQLMASGLLGGGNSIQGGLLGQLGNATQPYGGMGNLGLSLLANSGPTPYKRGFGQVFGQSALQSQDTANKNAEQKLQLMTGAMGLQQAMQRQKEYSDYVASMNGQQVPQGQPQGQPQAQGQPPDQSQSPDANLPPPMIRAPGFQGYDPSNPSQPAQQSQQAPQPQSAPSAPAGVSGLATPEQVNAAARYAMSQPNANPLEIQKARDAQLLAIAQRGAQSQIAPLEEVVKSPDSAKMVSANPQLQQVWRQVAPGLGMDPVKDFNDNNVRVAFTMAGNQIRTQSQLPTQAPPAQWRDVTAPNGLPAQQNSDTGERRQGAATEIDQYNFARKQGYAGSFTDFKRLNQTAPENSFNSAQADLLASLAERGISLPAGMRSKQQQVATLQGLLDRNQGKTADQIAESVGNGQINFGSDKKAATVAAGQEGKVSTAVNELGIFGDQALAASAKVPRRSFIPANQLMQMADSSISDPNLLTLKLKLNALNNAYNVLSARGGTDAESRKHVAQLFSSATGPEGVVALVKGLKEEASGAKSAARQASHVGSGGATADAGAHPADIQDLLSKYGH